MADETNRESNMDEKDKDKKKKASHGNDFFTDNDSKGDESGGEDSDM